MLKYCTTIVIVMALICDLAGQDTARVEATRLWTTATTSTIELVNEGFESGLGEFSNSGSVNWSTTNSLFYTGSSSATSGMVFNGQEAALTLEVVVPANYTATVQFYYIAEAVFGPDNIDDTEFRFIVDGDIQLNTPVDTFWTSKTYLISEGAHVLEWVALHSFGASDDQLQMYLDDVAISYQTGHALRIADGQEGAGKMLFSDQYGNASWKSFNDFQNIENSADLGILPMVLDGNQQFSSGALLTVKNGWAGIQSRENMSSGFTSDDNSGSGFFASDNEVVGLYAQRNYGGVFATNNDEYGLYCVSNGTHGILSKSNALDGVRSSDNQGNGYTAFSNDGYGYSATGNSQTGFNSEDNTGDGFYATSNSDDGFFASGNDDVGVNSSSNTNHGVSAVFNGGDGLYSVANTGDEGYFGGTVVVTGALSKGSGSFKIDHPLDPENKFLYHSFVESPDMMNVYNGNVTLDANGEATVELEDWFEVLNREFRYQLTAIGAPGPNLYISQEVTNNKFRIAGGSPGMKVSWQLTGVRQDPYAEQNRIQTEVEKPDKFKGYYLHPEAYGKSFEHGFDYIKLGRKTLEELKQESQSTDR